MKNSLILQFVCLLMLQCRASEEAAAAAAAHVRVVRSDATPVGLDVLVARVNQRLDVVEAENQALRNDVQTVQAKNDLLERTVEELRRNQPSSAATGVTSAPGGSATAQNPDVSLLKAQVEILGLRADAIDRKLQDLQNRTDLQALQRQLTSMGLKYQLIEEIVLNLKQETLDVQSNVTELQTDNRQLQQQVHSVAQMVTASQNVSSSVAALQAAVNSLGHGGGQSHSSAVAFQAYAANSESHLANGAVLRFPNVLTNEGQAYNGQTGKMVVTVEGLYLLLVSVEAKLHEGAQLLQLVVNGRSVTAGPDSTHSGPGSSTEIISLQALVRLHPGDQVWVQVQVSSSHHDDVEVQSGQGTSFMGLLLYG